MHFYSLMDNPSSGSVVGRVAGEGGGPGLPLLWEGVQEQGGPQGAHEEEGTQEVEPTQQDVRRVLSRNIYKTLIYIFLESFYIFLSEERM